MAELTEEDYNALCLVPAPKAIRLKSFMTPLVKTVCASFTL
ncbi:hypothetical protein FACS1894200_11230 [Spirochaetia bacterium]|nr:hypothetical protein FACS1894200_11230 [Spirochaetia bacterium]